MKKYSGILSILFLVFGVSTFYLAKYIQYFTDYMFQIMIVCYIVAWIFTLISEKGVGKRVSLIGLVFISILYIGFFLVMCLLWNTP